MSAHAAFIEELLRRVPDLRPTYNEHLRDNDTVLPHVFMGDVTRFAIAEAANARNRRAVVALLEYLEDCLKTGTDEVKGLIVVSFVENLIGETTALKSLKALIGPRLRTEVNRICE